MTLPHLQPARLETPRSAQRDAGGHPVPVRRALSSRSSTTLGSSCPSTRAWE